MRRSPKHDPQVEQAYKWEGDFVNWAGAHAKPSNIRAVIAKCCAMYRVPTPEIRFLSKDCRNGKKLSSEYDPNGHVISLRPRHWEMSTAIHEASHAIVDYVLGWDLPGHGKEWLGIFMHLLSAGGIAPRVALEAHADALGLEYCTPGKVAPAKIRKAFRGHVRRARDARRVRSMARKIMRELGQPLGALA